MYRIPSFSSKWLAPALVVFLVIWLAGGEVYQAADQAPEAPAPSAPLTPAFTVETAWFEAKPYPAQLRLQGQINAWQQVEVKTQVAGTIIELPRDQGDKVSKNQLLALLSDEGREARLAQAKALVALRETEMKSAKALQAKSLVAETEIDRLMSELSLAKAGLADAELAVRYKRVEAPIAGTLSQRRFDQGSWIDAGTTLFNLVDMTKLRAVAQVPQQKIHQLSLGQSVKVKMLDGRSFDATLAYISPMADPMSRTFQIEAHFDNGQGLPLAGASATLDIMLESERAHALSPALLALDDDGRLGVYASVDKRLHFFPVSLLRADIHEAWVAGLPARVEIVTRGAGFLKQGDTLVTAEAQQ